MTTRDTSPSDPCGDTGLTPKRPDNRPGLAEIAYRIGRHRDFLARMRAAIPETEVVDPATRRSAPPARRLDRADDRGSLRRPDGRLGGQPWTC